MKYWLKEFDVYDIKFICFFILYNFYYEFKLIKLLGFVFLFVFKLMKEKIIR